LHLFSWLLGKFRGRGPEQSADSRHVSAAQFTGIVAIASDAIISINEQQEVLNFNHGAEEIFGYAAHEIVGQRIELLIPQRFRTTHEAHVHRFGEGPVTSRRMGERREIAGLRKNGEEFPAEASISKLDVEGSRLYTVVLRDITERKRFELAQKFLAEAGSALVSSIDIDKTLETVANLIVPELADWCVIYAQRDDRGVARSAIAHHDPELQQQLRRQSLHLPVTRETHMVHRVLATGAPILLKQVSEGQLREMGENAAHAALLLEIGARSAIWVPMAARGKTTGAIALFWSTTPRLYDENDLALAEEIGRRAGLAIDNAELYRAAQTAIQARDDVLAVVSHDLGNPLSAIRIGTTLLLSNVPKEERETGAWKHIVGIRNSAEQMERLIKDLLEVKRIEAGQLSIERDRVDTRFLIDEAIELLTPIAEGKGVSIKSGVNGSVPQVYADRERLLQAFSNLVGNAVKFTPHGGEVQIAAEQRGDDVVFSVNDTGIGISPEDAQHVFDRYWQAQGRKKGRQGIGLGLVIVRGIVEAHGGRIWLESELGKGSRFYFNIPSWQNQITDE
jgi:PAS domain S-box-containing protein